MSITKVLVANRGEIARRVFRTCREIGISTVAVYSEPDIGEPHMLEADEAVLLAGSSASDTYLNVEAVLMAAKETGADAVHPGYGFLAENAAFARAVAEDGLSWIGPSPEAIEVMGSKIQSKRLMAETGVPVVPSIELEGLSSVRSAALSLGMPVLIKASAGGGGKGMRIVEDPDELLDSIEAARREAVSSFGDETVFLERYLKAPRHIEIQVFGDSHGKVISLYERECSIQRRHQKIIEESPSSVIDEATREKMGEAAVAAAKSVEYVGAGTVEFLYQEGEFYFLEMNTRLQVEHPVTEMVTGLDLVRLQIEIAEGMPLPDRGPKVDGHAIEARLYAEDPLNDFLPVTGRFHRFSFQDMPGLRVDSAIEDGSAVSVHYDPMIAKVIAHASNRETAAAVLSSALRRARIHGSKTNRALLVRTLEHPEFLAGETDTHFLERHDVSHLGRPLADQTQELLGALAAALCDQAEERAQTSVLTSVPSGWRNSASQLQHRVYEGAHGIHDVHYSLDPFFLSGLGEVVVMSASPESCVFSVDDVEHHYTVARYDEERFIDSEFGPVMLTVVPRFPSTLSEEEAGSLHAPMPGKVIRVDVEVGAEVADGEVLVVLEAMKMEHALRAPHAGIVTEVRHHAGDQVESGAVLVIVSE